jgi:peptidoglycan/xylan/chitin deacetylase (PgdA/CDA1 family)
MGMGRRLSWLILAGLAVGSTAAAASDCPGNPNALGVSRTIVVDPREHGRIGTMSYVETLPLADKEVVLTFDDGPIPPYTDKVLAMLAAECVKATYFIVGTMAREYPQLVKRIYDAGHTVGTHSMSHPIPFKRQGVEKTRAQIDDGIKTTEAALGDDRTIAPFFRFPGFGNTDHGEAHLAERGLMAWGADIPADDWRRIGGAEVAKRAMRRLDARGKGILLLHDIHQRTVDALPTILKELKAGGYRIVHVVPETPDRPKTITTAAEWRMHGQPQPALPTIAIADLQDLGGFDIAAKSASELCELKAQPAREQRTAKPRGGAHKAVRHAGRAKGTKAEKQAAAKPRHKAGKTSDAKDAAKSKAGGPSLLGIKLGETGDTARSSDKAAGKAVNHARAKHAGKPDSKLAGAKTAASDLRAAR